MVDDPSQARVKKPGMHPQMDRLSKTGIWFFVAILQAACLVLLLLFVVGCALPTPRIFSSASTRIGANDFRDPDAPTPPAEPIPPRGENRQTSPRVEIRTITQAQARGGVDAISTSPTTPTTPTTTLTPTTPPEKNQASGAEPQAGAHAQSPDVGTASTQAGADSAQSVPLQPADLIEVDAKVGDLNGKPIQASSWLAPMAARLRAESAGKNRQQWRKFAAKQISSRLVTELSDELYLAEARASLTPEQKTGLRVFLSRFERGLVSSNYGSATRTEEYLEQTQGQSLEEAKRDRERTVLITEQLRKVVWNRVQVSSRDIRNEYERQAKKYHPKAHAVFLLIRIRADDKDGIQIISDRLAVVPFPIVVKDGRNLSKEPLEKELEGDYATSPLFGPKALQDAAAALTPGQWAGPIEVGSSVYWVYLDRIDQKSISLYDAQLELRTEITAKRREEEARRYLLKLFNRAGIRGMDQLIYKLVDIAEQWYYQPDQS